MSFQRYKDQVSSLATLDFNYDEKLYHDSKDKYGWYIDKYSALLAVEPPGPPLAKGPFEVACETVRLYQFPDPKLIRAVFDPDRNLQGRDMLMIAKFMGFTFYFGVRVTSSIDENVVNSQGQEEKRWGYSYRTLKGHFEVGEIRFIVMKNLQTGEVHFEVNAYSKPDFISNPFYRLGFRLFGRMLQKHFARSSIRRLRRFSRHALSMVQSQARN